MTQETEPNCAECEDDLAGCPECDEGLAHCNRCGKVENLGELDENGDCQYCLDAAEDLRQKQSDYRQSVL